MRCTPARPAIRRCSRPTAIPPASSRPTSTSRAHTIIWIAGGAEANEGLVSFEISLTDSLLHDVGHHRPGAGPGHRSQHAAKGRTRLPPELRGVDLRVAARLREQHGWLARRPLHPALRRLLRAHPGLQLERPGALHRPDVEGLRAPTSDLNVTIGLALVAFGFFQLEGFRAPRRRRLPLQVLPLLRVQEGHRRRARRHLRRYHRAHPRVHQAGHAVGPTLRQHLRRRGRARRRHQPGHGLHLPWRSTAWRSS